MNLVFAKLYDFFLILKKRPVNAFPCLPSAVHGPPQQQHPPQKKIQQFVDHVYHVYHAYWSNSILRPNESYINNK